MTREYWATEELPGIAWDETQQPNPPTDPDLANQGITNQPITLVELTGDLL
ncbi:hypothetical protein ACIA6D_23385 [Streptomyces cacaoi]